MTNTTSRAQHAVPLRKFGRIEAISSTIRQMKPEEAYYRFSKFFRKGEDHRIRYALRIMLAEE